MANEGNQGMAMAKKSWIVAVLLCLFVGALGIHRFYLRQKGTGLAMLILTLTIVGYIVSLVWSIVDLIRLLFQGEERFDEMYNA